MPPLPSPRIETALWHLYRYDQVTHQCTRHVSEMTTRICWHCGTRLDCAHLGYERCHCDPVPCSDCTFEAAGGYL